MLHAIDVPCRVVRVPAISGSELSDTDIRYAALGVAATWMSHQSAMRKFLESEDQYCLILEDDFVIRGSLSVDLINKVINSNFDFFQIGFLRTSIFKAFAIRGSNLVDFSLKIMSRLFRLLNQNRILGRTLIREQNSVPFGFILNDIRAGGHCYLVSRRFARAMQECNTPAFLSTDGVYMSLGWMRLFKMARYYKPIALQSASPTSVEFRFKRSAD